MPFSLATLTELCSFWYSSKDLFPLHKLDDKDFLVTVKTESYMFQAVQEMSICMGGRYGLFRGEWVKALLSYNFTKYSKKKKN